MPSTNFETLLAELKALHANHPVLQAFNPFPATPKPQSAVPNYTPPAKLFEEERGFDKNQYTPFVNAALSVSREAAWRETYKNTRLDDGDSDFMSRFGCYCIVGKGGGFTAPHYAAYIVYMPPGLHYPEHHHPAEEIYFILSGEAEFKMRGHEAKRCRAGDHVFHPSMVPHATVTIDHPVFALVLWRGDMSVTPVLTGAEGAE